MPKIALGTAQIGLNYGIHNKSGKPSEAEAFSILNTAYDNGIEVLDTAYAYGDSEERIGQYINSTKRNFKICTKLPHIPNQKNVSYYINESLKRLSKTKIDFYLLHNIIQVNNKKIIDDLFRFKKDGSIDKIGVSVYDVNDVEIVLEKGIFDCIQIPMNIFDRRLLKSGHLEKIKNQNLEIFIRSIYLQGLFFLELNKINEVLSVWDRYACPLQSYLKSLNDFSHEFNTSIQDLILGWFKYNEYGNYIIIGVETNAQLQNNLDSFNKEVDNEIINKFNQFVNTIEISDDSIIIDPRRW